MNLTTSIILGLLILYVIFALKKFIFNITSGCCGTAVLKEKKIKKNSYPYHYDITIDDIHCENCCTKIENNLNHDDNLYAKVTLNDKTLHLDSQISLSQKELMDKIRHLGYHPSAIK